MTAPAVPIPHLSDASAARADPDVLADDAFAAEKAELQVRLNKICAALRNPTREAIERITPDVRDFETCLKSAADDLRSAIERGESARLRLDLLEKLNALMQIRDVRRARASGGCAKTTAQTVRFFERMTLRAADRDFINLGRPWRAPKPARGPWSRDTRYDVAADRWKGKIYRLDRLPGLRVGQGKVDLDRLAKLAAKLTAKYTDAIDARDLIRFIGELAPYKDVTSRELRKARALLRKRGKWPI